MTLCVYVHESKCLTDPAAFWTGAMCNMSFAAHVSNQKSFHYGCLSLQLSESGQTYTKAHADMYAAV